MLLLGVGLVFQNNPRGPASPTPNPMLVHCVAKTTQRKKAETGRDESITRNFLPGAYMESLITHARKKELRAYHRHGNSATTSYLAALSIIGIDHQYHLSFSMGIVRDDLEVRTLSSARLYIASVGLWVSGSQGPGGVSLDAISTYAAGEHVSPGSHI